MNLKTARNIFVHEGVASLGGVPLKWQDAVKYNQSAQEIISTVREWLPESMQWPTYTHRVQIGGSKLLFPAQAEDPANPTSEADERVIGPCHLIQVPSRLQPMSQLGNRFKQVQNRLPWAVHGAPPALRGGRWGVQRVPGAVHGTPGAVRGVPADPHGVPWGPRGIPTAAQRARGGSRGPRQSVRGTPKNSRGAPNSARRAPRADAARRERPPTGPVAP